MNRKIFLSALFFLYAAFGIIAFVLYENPGLYSRLCQAVPAGLFASETNAYLSPREVTFDTPDMTEVQSFMQRKQHLPKLKQKPVQRYPQSSLPKLQRKYLPIRVLMWLSPTIPIQPRTVPVVCLSEMVPLWITRSSALCVPEPRAMSYRLVMSGFS